MTHPLAQAFGSPLEAPAGQTGPPEILFYCQHLYYLPQFLPVASALPEVFEISFTISSRATAAEATIIRAEIERQGWRFANEDDLKRGVLQPDILIVGQSRDADRLAGPDTLVVLLFHGIGLKRVYYTDTNPRVNLRFVESQFRREQCLAVNPEVQTWAVGFAKLDPLLNGESLADHPLPAGSGPRVLYTPTFYPGSLEILADLIPEWPANWQIVIKPHQFTYTNPYYQYQVRLLEKLARNCPNVTVLPLTDYNVLNAFRWAEVLVSEASSTIIEFTALDKPIVICDELHLRLHHRLQRARFFRRRMDTDLLERLDFAHHAAKGVDVAYQIGQALENPLAMSDLRREARDLLLGPTDGGAAQRIAQILQDTGLNAYR